MNRAPARAIEAHPETIGTLRLWHWAAIAAPFMPLFANSFGWIFTEVGRQPWIVHNLMTVQNAVSPRVSAAEVAVSMVIYTLLYAALAVVEVKLFLKYVRLGAEAIPDPDHDADAARDDADAPLAYAY